MIAATTVALLATCVASFPVPVPVPVPVLDPDRASQSRSLEDYYDGGIPFADFLSKADARRETWHENYGHGEIAEHLLSRADALPGRFRLLVVAEDWCGDSANTIPYLARLIERTDRIDMRIIDSEVGKPLMEAHPTPDGRGATPTVLMLDEHGKQVGCWVERPTVLQDWWLSNPQKLDREAKLAEKYRWYDADRGVHTIDEVLERLESASRGTPICPAAE